MATVDLVKDVPGLTEEERSQLFSVMMKAKELDAQEENKMRQPLEGVLLKYTNVVKGWQLRWFVLSPETGYLDYYMPDEIKKHKPRGAVHLAGAVISPSDEDSQTFSVSAVCGEVYKLRANDAKERQFWVNRLRAVAEHHTQFIADKNPPLPPRDHRLTDGPASTNRAMSYLHYPLEQSSNIWSSSQLTISGTPKNSSSVATPADNIPLSINNAASVTEAFCSVKEMLRKTELNHQNLVKSVESLPLNGKQINCCHPDLLLLKATSNATVSCLEQCYTILQQQQVAANYPSGIPDGARVEWVQDTNKPGRSNLSTPDIGIKSNKAKRSPSNPESSVGNSPVLEKKCDPSGEVTDEEADCVEYADFDDKEKGNLLQLIGQLKLGMDLSKINFPAFILEPRSLLEVYSDLLSNLTILFSLSASNSAEERMVAILKWYLTSIHFFQMSSVARKPYNPIIGETFHCSWKIPTDPNNSDLFHHMTYVGEQVSHEPPITAIFAECEEKALSCECSIQVKPKFLGMYATVNLVGDVIIHLNEIGEKYIFTLPILHVRSLLSNPWIEFGGRVMIQCPESELTSYVTFHTKPFYGGKPHKISAECKMQNDVLCRVTGEWNEVLQFQYQDGSTEEIDVRNIKRFPKRVRPIKEQDVMESRRLWHNVSVALKRGNNDEAEEEKQILESNWRDESTKLQQEEYKGKLFHKKNDVWEYKYILRNRKN